MMIPLRKALCTVWQRTLLEKLRKGVGEALLAAGHMNLRLEMYTRIIFTVNQANIIAPQFLHH